MPGSQPMIPPDDLAPFAQALRSLSPQPMERSRDQLLFEAGRVSAKSIWHTLWPVLSVLFAGCTLVLGILLASPRPPLVVEKERVLERTVEVPVPMPSEILPSSNTTPAALQVSTDRKQPAEEEQARKMFQARQDVVRWGIDVLPRNPIPQTEGTISDIPRPKVDTEFADLMKVAPGVYASPYNLRGPVRPKDEQ